MLETFFTIVHVLACVVLILVVLLQSGKGGGVSAAFGGGAGVALGQRSAATVLGKITGGSAALFMVTSMVLAVYSSPSATDPTRKFIEESGAGGPATPAAEDTPVAPAGGAPAAPVGDAPAAPAGDAPAAPAGDAPAAPAGETPELQ